MGRPRRHHCDHAVLDELATLRFVEDNYCAFILGAPSGSGKTHLAHALGTSPAVAATPTWQRLWRPFAAARAEGSGNAVHPDGSLHQRWAAAVLHWEAIRIAELDGIQDVRNQTGHTHR